MANTKQEEKTESTETAIVPFNPTAPVGSKRNLQGLLTRQMGALKQVLPRHVTPERLVKTLLVAINRQPELLECTQESVLESVGRAAELGLDLSGTLGEAYLVPFNNKIKVNGRDQWRKQATFIPGYRGLAKLARQSGEVKRIEANMVYEKDHFDFQEGTDFRLHYKRSLETDRGKKLGAYSLVEFKDGGVQADWMTVAEIEKIRQQAKSKDSLAWKQHWDEMGKKTVFRRLSKWLPLSGEKWEKVLAADNTDYEEGFGMDVIDLEPGESKADRLAGEIAAGGDAPADDTEPEAETSEGEESGDGTESEDPPQHTGPPWLDKAVAKGLKKRALDTMDDDAWTELLMEHGAESDDKIPASAEADLLEAIRAQKG